MAKSRREFLGTASAGLIGGVAAPDALPGESVASCRREQQPTQKARLERRRVWRGAGGGAGGFADDVCRSGEAGADFAECGRARGGGGELARDDGGAVRAAHWAAQGGDRRRRWRRIRSGIRCCRGRKLGRRAIVFVRSKDDAGALPASDEDIAFAPVTKLSRWIESAASLLRSG